MSFINNRINVNGFMKVIQYPQESYVETHRKEIFYDVRC